MSWASRRRTLYLTGIGAFFLVVIGVPAAFMLHKPATCFDGVQNQNETAVDKGGPCRLLDEHSLSPHAVLWTRPFYIRDGFYSVAAYIDNPNKDAGVMSAPYRFKVYDENNILVAERTGSTFIMPGTITPVFEGQLATGNRKGVRAFFEFSAPLVWERSRDISHDIVIKNREVVDNTTAPRISAQAQNTSVSKVKDIAFIAVVFDTAGNAFAASQTVVREIGAGQEFKIVFTWPQAFARPVGHVDITPLRPPAPAPQ